MNFHTDFNNCLQVQHIFMMYIFQITVFITGFKGEYKSPFSKETIVQKVHTRKLRKYDGQRYAKVVKNCILLVRNPLAAYISDYQREISSRKINSLKRRDNFLNPHSEQSTIKIGQFVKAFKNYKSSMFYDNFVWFWNKCEDSKHVIFYEERVEEISVRTRRGQITTDMAIIDLRQSF